jgi:hypothetical protein
VSDFDAAGAFETFGRDADPVQRGQGSRDVLADDGPGLGPLLEGQGPGFDQGRVDVLIERLQEDPDETGFVAIDAGGPQRHVGHLEIAEELVLPFLFGGPEFGREQFEISGDIPVPEESLDAGDDGFGSPVVLWARPAQIEDRPGRQDEEEKGPDDRFFHGQPDYSIIFRPPPSDRAGFMPSGGPFLLLENRRSAARDRPDGRAGLQAVNLFY